MQLSDFDYTLPKELIAQYPVKERDSSRLMVLNRETGSVIHTHFFKIIDFLRESDVLVVNDTKVFPARIHGFKDTGGNVEVLLLRQLDKNNRWSCWEVLLNKGGRIKKGKALFFDNGKLRGVLKEFNGSGKGIMEFDYSGDFFEILEKIGETPLPPYIKRQGSRVKGQEVDVAADFSLRDKVTQNSKLSTVHYSLFTDKERYQTVYAREKGAVAAPTAGLHFTESLLKKIKDIGVEVLNITLHVSLGTFKPVKAENIEKHIMDAERYVITPENAERLNRAKESKKRIIAVGTTTARTLESEIEKYGKFTEGEKETALFIYPGFQFRAVDGLITNFHLPKSTLLMLVSAFCGLERILECYKEAIDKRYRFYSYGDAMFII